MTAFALLFTLSAIGIAETAYLIRTRKASEHAVCVIGKGCTQVLEGGYNRMFGIHNDALGMAFYLAMGLLTALLVIRVEPAELWNILVGMLLGGAVIMTLYFLFLQWRVIKAWCFWCLMSAVTIGSMALILALKDFVLVGTR